MSLHIIRTCASLEAFRAETGPEKRHAEEVEVNTRSINALNVFIKFV